MEAVSRRRWLFYLAAGAFALWIGYLAYLVIVHDRPQLKWSPFGIHKPPEIVLSRSQLLESDLVVSAQLDEINGPAEDCIVLIDRKGSAAGRNIGKQAVFNVADCKDSWQGPGRYLLPLVQDVDGYSVTRVPPTPGFPAQAPGRSGPPRIYPDRADTRGQVEQSAH